MPENYLRAILLLAGIEPLKLYELANGYWPDVPDYADLRRENPWWLIRTEFGMLRVGWRKRVIAIDWEETPVRALVTADGVTKDETMVHAYSYADAVRYLAAWLGKARTTAAGSPLREGGE